MNKLRKIYEQVANNEGMALMMVLVIAAVSLAVVSSMIAILLSGTKISGSQKRFTTALEAGKGGEAIVFEFIGTRNDLRQQLKTAINFETGYTGTATIADSCIYDKLNNSTENWNDCPAVAAKTFIDPSKKDTYDFKFALGDYAVYGKIVNTIEGNTGSQQPSGGGKEGDAYGGVTSQGGGSGKGGISGSGEIPVMPIPALYVIELQSQHSSIPSERAQLSILYQY